MKNLIKKKGFLYKYIEGQLTNYQREKLGFISAFLSKLHISSLTESSPNYEKIYTDLLEKEIDEHWTIAQADHLNQLFLQLDALHRITRNKNLIINPSEELYSEITAIINPNTFPIFSTIAKASNEITLWNYKPNLLEELEKEIGFNLYVKQSTVEHHLAGDGLFLCCEKTIPPGTLLGFYPGIFYSPQEENDKKGLLFRFDKSKFDTTAELPFPFPLGKAISELSNSKKKFVAPEFVNPYALGNKINHPPPDIAANAITLDIIIPYNFFLEDYLKFLPYCEFSKKDKKYKKSFWNNSFKAVGVFSLDTLSDGEEIFIDYFENNLINWDEITELQDWQIVPPPMSPFFVKDKYEYEFRGIAKLIEWYTKYKNREQFYGKISKTIRPTDINYQQEGYIYKKIHNKNN